ncbi:MAG: hypothetical protein JO023_14420 [Chloroflexi bacterium]|nr:hypothetical protein [Chloroflexota bacterium]
MIGSDTLGTADGRARHGGPGLRGVDRHELLDERLRLALGSTLTCVVAGG